MNFLFYLFCTLLYALTSNSFLLLARDLRWLLLFIPAFLFINAIPGLFLKTRSLRLRICNHGGRILAIFLASSMISVIWHIHLAIRSIPDDIPTLLWSMLLCVILEAILFWNGILCVYMTSVQLGIKQRVIGALCGMIPIANLIALESIIKISLAEARFEAKREALNHARRKDRLCATKYPLLLVHGVFFRDSNFFNYWGRIPADLIENGAVIYYGNHQSAASVEDSASELTERIKAIVDENGCEKLNIIAHSKGGLDCKYALSKLDAAPYVASLTTINTPHKGCIFADVLLTKIPEQVKNKAADMYNAALRKFGDSKPDFIAAVSNLTASFCTSLDCDNIPEEIYQRSVGSVMPKACDGKFPLNLSYHLVKYFDGPNDGLVSTDSFKWGSNHRVLTPKGRRGISHADMIDLNRENIDGFDVREFYLELVHELKEQGL
ncbi:MAG: triacylglycerol lipase [Clostridia bacterium]|nr:triacylglycerol lipase [Clostridia bacterium]